MNEEVSKKESFSKAARPRDPVTVFAETFHKTPALVSYRVRCGKANCRCARGDLHGPYWFLRWRDGTRQRRRYVKAEELDAVRAVVATRRRQDIHERCAVLLARAELRGLNQWLRQMEHDLFN